MSDRSKQTASLNAALWRATLLAFAILLMTGPAMYSLLKEAQARRPAENPRRAHFGALWSSATEGASLGQVVAAMGRADNQSSHLERIPACRDPCEAPCTTYHTCVAEHEWYSSLSSDSADVYSICVDDHEVVRQVSKGMRFQFDVSGLSSHDTFAGFIRLQLVATLLAVPLAAALALWHRFVPLRTRVE